MDMTHDKPERQVDQTEGFNKKLFDDRLKALGLPTVAEQVKALGLPNRQALHQIKSGVVPGLHRGHKVANRLGVHVLQLWPMGCDE